MYMEFKHHFRSFLWIRLRVHFEFFATRSGRFRGHFRLSIYKLSIYRLSLLRLSLHLLSLFRLSIYWQNMLFRKLAVSNNPSKCAFKYVTDSICACISGLTVGLTPDFREFSSRKSDQEQEIFGGHLKTMSVHVHGSGFSSRSSDRGNCDPVLFFSKSMPEIFQSCSENPTKSPVPLSSYYKQIIDQFKAWPGLKVRRLAILLWSGVKWRVKCTSFMQHLESFMHSVFAPHERMDGWMDEAFKNSLGEF